MRLIIRLLCLVSTVFVLSSCTSATKPALEMAPLSSLPQEVQNASINVQEAYRFALANPELLQQIPCYCGCGAVGHTSNYDCYVAEIEEDGTVLFDNHAFG